jgi:hypothetical protein
MTLAALIALVVGGFILTALLALGMADPPRIGSLQWQADSPPEGPMPLPTAFTLELTARNDGPADSAWGIQFEQSLTILIDNQGYVSVSADGVLHWAEFPHIRPNASNQLYLHVEANGAATLRINHEIAWVGVVNAQSWTVANHSQPALIWDNVALYHE